VGPQERALIEETGFRSFPPRLSWQPIFYPVVNEEYATIIARNWNVRESGSGFVTPFQMRAANLRRFDVQQVGGNLHQEHWIRSEDLPEFKATIDGPIDVIVTITHDQQTEQA